MRWSKVLLIAVATVFLSAQISTIPPGGTGNVPDVVSGGVGGITVTTAGNGNKEVDPDLAVLASLGTSQTIPGAKILSSLSNNVCSVQKYTVAETALTAGATTQDITLLTLPARGKVCAVSVKHSAAFTGGGLTAMTVSLGRTGNTTFYTAANDIFIAPTDLLIQDTSLYKSGTHASEAVLARFTSTSANVSAATAGSVDIWVGTLVLP